MTALYTILVQYPSGDVSHEPCRYFSYNKKFLDFFEIREHANKLVTHPQRKMLAIAKLAEGGAALVDNRWRYKFKWNAYVYRLTTEQIVMRTELDRLSIDMLEFKDEIRSGNTANNALFDDRRNRYLELQAKFNYSLTSSLPPVIV